jgi:hypothetical protein
MIMDNCRQACPYNTLDGCKVKEYNAICPLTNMATPVTEYRMTNGDRIRSMGDEELAVLINKGIWSCEDCQEYVKCDKRCDEHCLEWLKQPAEDYHG